jgi:hypothetical protein
MAKRDYSPFLPQTGFDYTVKGVNFRTSTANFEEADDPSAPVQVCISHRSSI